MRKLFCLMIASLMALTAVRAAELSVAWDANTESDLAGYRVYYRDVNQSNPLVVDVGLETLATVTNLMNGITYEFYATAYNTAGLESAPSNKIYYTVPTGLAPDISEVFASKIVNNAGKWTFTINWQALSQEDYNFTNYVVNVKNLDNDSTNYYLTATNSYEFKDLPVDDYQIFVTVSNLFGVSPGQTFLTLSETLPSRPTNFKFQ